MRGIVRFAGYLPFHRLDTSEIRAFMGSGGGKLARTVAGYDEDTTTMGVEALRSALTGSRPPEPAGDQAGLATRISSLVFSTATPAYLDKTNAAVLHAACSLERRSLCTDAGGSLRSGTGALLAALGSPFAGSSSFGGRSGLAAVVLSDLRDGLPTSVDESQGGDAAAAFVIGDDAPDAPVAAELLGSASVTEEFLDRWRTPGERRSRVWEERFGETRYLELGIEAFNAALERSSLQPSGISKVAVTGMHLRAVAGVAKKLGVAVDDLASRTGQAGCAQPGIALVSLLEQASPGEIVVLVHLADGADSLVFRATEALAGAKSSRSLQAQVASGGSLPYGRFLSWRSMLEPEPPRRPEPGRVSSTAAWRSKDWKFAFTGSRDRGSSAIHLPPARVSMAGGAFDDMDPVSFAGAQGSIATFTVDRLAFSPSPPLIFAVVDFDGGGRFPVELTDCDESEVSIGQRVEMSFRRIYSSDGIHDYFWKARPIR